MKVIINVSNLYVGGGVQVAISFINELKFITNKNEYHIFLSHPVNKQIEKKLFSSNFNFYLIRKSIASLKTRQITVNQLDKLEKNINPDIIFTLFGPSFWKPKSKTLMGFADPWILNQHSIAYDKLKFFDKILRKFHNIYKIYYLKNEAEYFVLETNDAKKKLRDLLKISERKIYVVGNSYSDVFNNKNLLSNKNKSFITLPKKETNEFRLMLISHNYIHKNLKIIRDLVPLLKSYKVKFILTIKEKEFDEMFFDLKDHVFNLKPIKLNSCPSVYSQCDALFLPSLLEVFSASYVEAMKMQKPILTSNYSFAKDICGKAALYFDPLNAKDIAKKIRKLINDKKLQYNLIKNGNIQISKFETPKSRAEKYLKILDKLSRKSINI